MRLLTRYFTVLCICLGLWATIAFRAEAAPNTVALTGLANAMLVAQTTLDPCNHDPAFRDDDVNQDGVIDLGELLRDIQIYNTGQRDAHGQPIPGSGYHRRGNADPSTEDCFVPGPAEGFAYTADAIPANGGTISTSPPLATGYAPGTQLTITANPMAGFTFAYFTVNNGSALTDNPLTYTVMGETHVQAVFYPVSPVIYDLSIATNGYNGHGTVTQTQVQQKSCCGYPAGSVVQLEAIPDADSVFIGWSSNVDSPFVNPTTVTMNSNMNVIASFELKTYTVSRATQGDGTLEIDPVQSTYNDGTSVTLSAVPSFGWHFDHFEGDLTGTTAAQSVVMHHNFNVTAVFMRDAISAYNVNTSVTPLGAGTVAPSGGLYLQGVGVTLTATANSGFIFDHWDMGTISSDNPFSFTMPAQDTTVRAVFIPVHSLNYTVSGSGFATSGFASGLDRGALPVGLSLFSQSVIIEAFPNQGNYFEKFILHYQDGTTAEFPANPRLSLDMAQDYGLEVVFKPITAGLDLVTLDMNMADGGYTVPTSVGIYTYLRNDTNPPTLFLNASPSFPNTFSHWTGDVTDATNAKTTVVLDVSKVVTAVFNLVSGEGEGEGEGQSTPITISTQPVGGMATVGSAFDLNVVASGGAGQLYYAWHIRHPDGTILEFTPVQYSPLHIDSVMLGDNEIYVTVSDLFGSPTATSETVVVIGAPVIPSTPTILWPDNLQPAADGTITLPLVNYDEGMHGDLVLIFDNVIDAASGDGRGGVVFANVHEKTRAALKTLVSFDRKGVVIPVIQNDTDRDYLVGYIWQLITVGSMPTRDVCNPCSLGLDKTPLTDVSIAPILDPAHSDFSWANLP